MFFVQSLSLHSDLLPPHHELQPKLRVTHCPKHSDTKSHQVVIYTINHLSTGNPYFWQQVAYFVWYYTPSSVIFVVIKCMISSYYSSTILTEKSCAFGRLSSKFVGSPFVSNLGRWSKICIHPSWLGNNFKIKLLENENPLTDPPPNTDLLIR